MREALPSTSISFLTEYWPMKAASIATATKYNAAQQEKEHKFEDQLGKSMTKESSFCAMNAKRLPYGTGKRFKRQYSTTDMDEDNVIAKVAVALETWKKTFSISCA